MLSRSINAAILAVAAVLCAALIQPTLANGQPAPAAEACPDIGRYAVGGYPQTGIVPAGYEPVHTPGGIFFWENGGYAHGQRVGAANVVHTVDEFAARCPGVSIALYGYSYGGGVVATAAETINARPYAGQVHVHVDGGPRHPGGVETSWRHTAVGHLLGFRGPVTRTGALASYRSVCNPRDAICDMPAPWLILPTLDHIAGYLHGQHVYPGPSL